ncbi:MAG: CarD family transcriptional regulator [Geminicoccaceae bacterium]|jgi:CarD family transcriptional regulator|nr:MAG: CarD family transcriptional regulator [Geminicoccaceae bacterium]
MATKKLTFAAGDYIVYPSHGVGRITGIETQVIAGMELEMYVVSFENERLILRVPVDKAQKAGMRKLSSREKIQSAMEALKVRTRPRRNVMWSRRAQEYEAKINSGDPVAIAEVVRELHRPEDAEQSYSERQMYRAALERLAREVAAIEKIDEAEASRRLESVLLKAA